VGESLRKESIFPANRSADNPVADQPSPLRAPFLGLDEALAVNACTNVERFGIRGHVPSASPDKKPIPAAMGPVENRRNNSCQSRKIAGPLYSSDCKIDKLSCLGRSATDDDLGHRDEEGPATLRSVNSQDCSGG
jgi:hypothetical protein